MTFLAINTILPIARLTAKPTEPLKRKQRRLTGRVKKHAKWGDKKEAIKRNPSQCDSRAGNRRVAGDLSLWRRECWGACGGSLTISSSTPKEIHSTLFWQVLHWPSPSLNKPLLSLPLLVFPFLFLVQVGMFFYWQYSHKSMIFQFSSHISSSSSGGSLSINPLSGFPP